MNSKEKNSLISSSFLPEIVLSGSTLSKASIKSRLLQLYWQILVPLNSSFDPNINVICVYSTLLND